MGSDRFHGYRLSRARSDRFRRAEKRSGVRVLARRWIAYLVALMVGAVSAHAQQSASARRALVIDRVTVIDIEHGALLPAQRVVIIGNRIRRAGPLGSTKLPKRAQIVDARGKYLILGLWDMHFHLWVLPDVVYPLLLANGVTGIRDMGTGIALDTLRQWRREILAGTRVGPPRQLFAGPMLEDYGPQASSMPCGPQCFHGVRPTLPVHGPEHMRHIVDSLQAAGADFIKTHGQGPETYWALVSEARRVGIRFAGHLPTGVENAALVASDSGQWTIEHIDGGGGAIRGCVGKAATVMACRPIAERHRRNGTWDLLGPAWPVGRPKHMTAREDWRRYRFWPDAVTRDWPAPSDSAFDHAPVPKSYPFDLGIVEQAGLPLLIGTDIGPPRQGVGVPGFRLHDDLSIYVDGGLTPLAALRAVTLNPALMLHATDSLGTVAPGKLADLVLLDANPLENITNTTKIRAVVANGRYFDRAALDQLLAEVRTEVKQSP